MSEQELPAFCKLFPAYQIPRVCCIPRLTAVIPIQQHNPIIMGFPPVFTNLTILVFNPIAAIAIMIKNLDNSLSGVKKLAGTPMEVAIVVITEAPIKNKIIPP